MSVKIRLSRHGRKKYPFYHIVVADSRAPRDGKFIEKLGVYNPNVNPAVIELNFDKALDWLQKGAQPTITAKRILSYQGVLMKKHLLEGAKKGAFSEEDAESKFQTWLQTKQQKREDKVQGLTKAQQTEAQKRLEAEQKVNQERLDARNSALAEAEKAAQEAADAEEEAKKAEEAEGTEAETSEEATETPAEEAPKEDDKPAE